MGSLRSTTATQQQNGRWEPALWAILMPSFDAGIDYLEMLGLDLSDGSPVGIDALKQTIRDKRKEWTAQAVNPLYQQQARRSLDVIRGFEKLLSRPDALQDYLKQLTQLHARKRHLQEREVGNLVRAAVSSRGYLTTRQRELLISQVEEQHISEAVVDAVIERLGVEVRTPGRIAAGPPELPYESPALDRTVLAQVGNWLKILEAGSFYELLDLPVYAPVAAIRVQAEAQFARWSRVLPKTTEAIAWEKSMQACLTWLKDDDSREQYNRALFNERIDRFVRRVDLLLAGGQITRDDQIEMTRVGTREFGLSSSVVSRCIQARVVAAGISMDRPVAVTVLMQGQCQCMRCYSWSPRQNVRCWSCGGTLAKRCANPFCKKKASSGSRACDHCHLPNAQGKRFATLLTMGDTALRQADWETAVSAYRTARRILSTEHLDARQKQAGRVRSLLANVTEQLADNALAAAKETLSELAQLAPEMNVAGVPTLEEVTAQIRRLTAHCRSVQKLEDPIEAAGMWSQILDRWSDCNPAYHSLRFLCESLARDGHARVALDHAQTLLTLRPNDDVLRRWTVKVRKWQSQNEAARRGAARSSQQTQPNGTDQPVNGHSVAHVNGNNGNGRNGNSNGSQNGHHNGSKNGVHRVLIDPAVLRTEATRES